MTNSFKTSRFCYIKSPLFKPEIRLQAKYSLLPNAWANQTNVKSASVPDVCSCQPGECVVFDCFHTTAKCVFWILIRNAHFELRSVHMIEVLAYFELRIIHTSDRKCDSPLESVEKRHGCVWVACQSNMHVCCLRFLCMCSARYYRWKWLEGHTSSAPQNTILRSSHSYTDFVAWFARIVTGKTPLYRDLRCAFQITFCDVIWHIFFAYFEF